MKIYRTPIWNQVSFYHQISYEKTLSFQTVLDFEITNKKLCSCVPFFFSFCREAGWTPPLTGAGPRMITREVCVWPLLIISSNSPVITTALWSWDILIHVIFYVIIIEETSKWSNVSSTFEEGMSVLFTDGSQALEGVPDTFQVLSIC